MMIAILWVSYLQKEKMLSDILHQLLFSILWVKFGQEVECNWLLLWHLLVQNLQRNHNTVWATYLILMLRHGKQKAKHLPSYPSSATPQYLWCCTGVQKTTSPSVPESGTPGQKDLFLSISPAEQNNQNLTQVGVFDIGREIPLSLSAQIWHNNISSWAQSPSSKPLLLSPPSGGLWLRISEIF